MKEKKATWPRQSVSKTRTRRLRKKGSTCVGEDDIGDCFKALVKTCRNRNVHLSVTGSFYTNTDHGDDYGRQDRYETRNRHVANFFQRPWHRADKTHNHTHDAEHDCASPVRSDRIQHDRERKDMAAHDED